MTITMPGRFTLGAVAALLALTALFLAVVATSTGSVQGSEQVCEYDVILMEEVCTSSDGETKLSTTSTPTPEPTEESDLARWMPVPDVLHDGSLRPTKEPIVIPPIPPIKNFTYTISTATPKPRVRMLRQVRDVQVQNDQGAQGQGAQIQQTSGVLVKNTNQTDAGDFPLDQDYAQPFTTGSNTHGYKLTSVQIEFTKELSPPKYSVQILNEFTNPAGQKFPGNHAIATLKNPTSLVAGNNEFTATGSGIDLDPGTTYFIFFDAHKNLNTVGTPTSIRSTATDNEDAGAADGWSIGNNGHSRSWKSTFWTGGGSQKVQVAVNGFTITLPALTSQVVTGTTLVLTFDQNLDTASRPAAGQFGIRFGGGALKRATAIAISGKQVTLTVPEVRAGQVVTVSYTKPTRNPLRNTAGLASDSFSDQPVTVNADQVRSAQYVTYNNADGEKEVVENRAASADLDTLLDYFRDSCISQRSLQTAHDYSQYTEIDGRRVMTQARNGWKWGWVQDATTGVVTGTKPFTISECVNDMMYQKRAFCENLDNGIVSLPEGSREGTCPTNRNW